jgi:hypothetical protein
VSLLLLCMGKEVIEVQTFYAENSAVLVVTLCHWVSCS